MTPEDVLKLRAEFPAEQVGQLPKAGVQLDYVGHAAVRLRLLDVDPEWNWEPCATDDGLPRFDTDGDGNPIGLWIRLTVAGVTRLGYGSCPSKQFDAEKVLIGDALRNAAMSFGVATYLWVKGHTDDAPADGPRERKARKPKDEGFMGFASRDEAKLAHDAALIAWQALSEDVRPVYPPVPMSKEKLDAFMAELDQLLARPFIPRQNTSLPLDTAPV